MGTRAFPTVNPKATGRRIAQLRKEHGLTVKDLQVYFGFDAPQAIYKWQSGKCLPTLDNLLGLSVLFGVSIESILITSSSKKENAVDFEPEGSVFFICDFSFFREPLIHSEIPHRVPFSPSASCKNLEIAPLFLRFLQAQLTKNSLLCAPPHFISVSLAA